ncbi:YhcN/YlaJ family sporulation lipoprotein [Desulfallas sp. Bu1-1]|jgi:YhcN/YlaJ family sporulation lipoprotein|uniref:YhcN/YlaJ family sporulation lipoprotein n=1 Tax=Desulfallas sp. Bu1-1 TaxID=2787620 RepID=UPI0018A0ACAC|nr:YhcN/YlaJ family sporulation lipoprotein [Desulfallas sp. Bu1-1]MBF7081779.1 YhcN/YlaJ family sporulation lipoprotein [Desulfallas sp. Bu1-1]
MNSRKRILHLLLSLLVLSIFIFSGCSAAARKPAPTEPAPNQARTGNVANEKAQRIAREADRVKWVKSSTVVVAGNKAYVGLDINANIEKSQTKEVEKAVINRIKNLEPTIKTVYVSSDPDIVTRIKKVSRGIAQGKPVTSFARELTEIGRRVTPRTM